MKPWLTLLLILPLLACSALGEDGVAEAPTSKIPLPDLGEAPELTNEVWLNTDSPLRLSDLRGKVVLLEMWTFG